MRRTLGHSLAHNAGDRRVFWLGHSCYTARAWRSFLPLLQVVRSTCKTRNQLFVKYQGHCLVCQRLTPLVTSPDGLLVHSIGQFSRCTHGYHYPGARGWRPWPCDSWSASPRTCPRHPARALSHPLSPVTTGRNADHAAPWRSAACVQREAASLSPRASLS